MTPLSRRALVGWVRWAGGALFVLGLLGLFRGHFADFLGHEGVSILGFTGSPLTNVIHLLVGLGLIAVLGSVAATRTATLAIGIAFTVFGLLEFALGDGTADIFGRNTRMGLLDLVIGLTGLAVWFWERAERTD